MTSSNKALQQIRKMRHFECRNSEKFEKFGDIIPNNGLIFWESVLCPPITDYSDYANLSTSSTRSLTT